jgi:glyoxylase-like metal-dependent hydrolase (beta-lactamase superfamily II)
MARRAEIGGADIWQVEEITQKKPLSAITNDVELLARLPKWLFPRFIDTESQVDIVSQSWIVIVDGRVVVVDPCTGNGRNFPDFPPAHMLDTPYLERFAATGVRPADVDYVFCTHLHMDHCGWNTLLRAGRYVPTFPNARYVMVRREFDRWDSRRPDHVPVPANAGTFENSVLPVLEAGLAELVPDTFRISARLQVEPAPGHTIGHSLLHFDGASREAYFVGDAFHHPLEMLHPDLDTQTSESFPLTSRTRRRIIDNCLSRNALVIPAHFPCAFGGALKRDNGELMFEPFGDARAPPGAPCR